MSAGGTRRALRTIGAGLGELARQRWVRVALALALVLLAARFAGVWALGRAARALAREHGLDCRWEELDLSLLQGRGSVSHLALHAAGQEGPPLLDVEYAVFDIDVRALLAGDISIRRAEIDGLDALLERAPDGVWNVERHVDPARFLSALAQDAPEEPPAEGGVEPIELAPPLAVSALRVQHARLHLVDRSVEPPLDAVLEANVRLSDLGAADRRVRFSAALSGGDLLDEARVDGSASWRNDALDLELAAQAGSLRPRALAPYLARLGIEPRAGSIEARLALTATLAVAGEKRDELGLRAALSGLRLAADGAPAFEVDRVALEVPSLSRRGARLTSIDVDGVRGRVVLEPGALRLGGVALLAARPGASARPRWAELFRSWTALWRPERCPRWLALLVRRDPDATPWTLEHLAVRDVALGLIDESVEPPAELALRSGALELGPVIHDPGVASAPIPLVLTFAAPGLAEGVRVEGSFAPFAPRRGADVTLSVEGIGLAALDPYLRRAGVERAIERGALRAHLVAEAETDEQGRSEGRIELEELALDDGGRLFGVKRVGARGIVVDPQAGLVRLGDVEVQGPELALARGPSRALLAFGLRTIGGTPSVRPQPPAGERAPPPAVSGAPAAPSPGRPPPRLELGRLAWTGTQLSFLDESTAPPTRIAVDELGFELTGLTLGGDPARPEPEPARLSARFAAGGMAEELVLEGSVRSKPGPIDLSIELAARGHGLRGRLVAPYLRELGLEPALEDGRLGFALAAAVRETPAGWSGELRLADVALADGSQELLAIDALSVEGFALEGGAVSAARVSLVKPFARVARAADGALCAAGLRLPASGPEDPAAQASVQPSELRLPSLPALRVGAVELEDLRLAWSDERVDPRLALDVSADATLAALDLGGGGRGTLRASAALAGAADEIALEGSFALGETWDLALKIAGRGLRPGGLAAYLPPGVSAGTEAGTLELELAAALSAHADGGLAGSAELARLSWRAEGADEPWLACGGVYARIPRLDPARGVYALGPVKTWGVSASARRDAGGAWHALGFVLDPRAARPLAGEPVNVAPGVGAAAPRVELTEAISLGIDRLVLVDETLGPGARPLVARLALHVDGPCVLVDQSPQGLPPLAARVEAAVAGLGELELTARAAPFAEEPALALELAARDVRTQGLVELVPALGALARGEVEEGELEASLAVQLDVRRSRPHDLGLAREFGLDLRLARLAWRDRPGGRVLFGIDGVAAEGVRVDPRKGTVRARTVEVARPHGVLRRDAAGLHALGFVIAAAPGAAEGGAPAAEPARPRAVEASAPRDGGGPGGPRGRGEVAVDELVVSGIELELADETGDPPARLLLNALDLELARFTTRALQEPLPVQLSAYLGAGPAGPAGRPAFEELALAGRVTLFPAPSGWVQVDLAALELAPFAGLAAAQGVSVEDGALDAGVRVRLKGERGAVVDSTLVFTDLELAEPADGPIERFLSLPVQLNTALFLLRNQDREHRFSLGFPVAPDGLSTGRLALAASGALAEIIARAVAAAPLRLLVGIVPGSQQDRDPPRETRAIAFEPGATDLSIAARDALADVARRLRAEPSLAVVLRHELAPQDRQRAAVLANPSPQECVEIASGLRQHKAELARRREELAAAARAFYAVGRSAEARAASEELRALGRRILTAEDGLDRVLEITRRDSERQREKRTRAAGREIAERRLALAQELLAAALGDPARIDVRSAGGVAVEGLAAGRIVVELRGR